MSGAAAVILAFAFGTGVTWLLLLLVSRRRSPVENRLRRHSDDKFRWPDDEAAQTVASARRVAAPVGAGADAPKKKGPLAAIFAKAKKNKRKKAIEGQIIDALTLMSSSLKAGYSFLQATEMAAREVPPPLGEEFGRTLHEMSMGRPVDDSLNELAQRTGVEDLDLVVTAVIIQRQVGGNLAEVLDTIAHTIRERIRIRGEIKTLTAQGRISGLIIGALPLAILLFITLINPGYIVPLFQNPIGLLFIGMGVSGQVIGMMLIRKIINIEV